MNFRPIALSQAASVLTTACLITEIREVNPGMGMPADDGMGM